MKNLIFLFFIFYFNNAFSDGTPTTNSEINKELISEINKERRFTSEIDNIEKNKDEGIILTINCLSYQKFFHDHSLIDYQIKVINYTTHCNKKDQYECHCSDEQLAGVN